MNQNVDGSLTSQIEDVFTRACTIHHPNKPWINLYWAAYHETQGNFDGAIAILQRLDSTTPTSLVVAYRHINLERRRGNLGGCSDLFKKYIEELRTKSPANSVHLSLKYARFLNKVINYLNNVFRENLTLKYSLHFRLWETTKLRSRFCKVLSMSIPQLGRDASWPWLKSGWNGLP